MNAHTAAEVAQLFASALALHREGRLQDAARLYLEVLAREPDHFDACHLLGVFALQTNDLLAACDLIGRAIEIDPAVALAHSNLAVAQQRRGQLEQALSSCQNALQLAPDSADALNNCGSVLHDLKRYPEAIACFERLLRRDVDHVGALSNLGQTLNAIGRYEEAQACLERACALAPSMVAVLLNLGNTLQYTHRTGAALAAYARALALDPCNPDVNFSAGACHLLEGDFAAGLPKFEWRWRKASCPASLDRFTQPLWLGQDSLHGKTILLHAEQGFGDTIQFCRYAAPVAALGARVIVQVQPALKAVLQGLPGASAVLATDDDLPHIDLHCPLMSLPLALGTRLDSIPANGSYLGADPGKAAQWRARLGTPARPRVGLVWSGSRGHDNDAARSIGLPAMLRLLRPDLEWVALQKDLSVPETLLLARTPDLPSFADAQHDFADTAALVAQLDLVITVDTALAHLAGAMGKLVWLLLPFAPDWRWMLERADTPWYPSTRLLRQPRLGDWDSVIGAVAAALAERYGRR